MSTPKDGDLQVWNIINPPSEPTAWPVNNPEHAIRLINELANSQLLIPTITSNVFGLEVFEEGEWLEWYNEDGNDIHEAFPELP